MSGCCDHVIPLADCDCRHCPCATAQVDPLDLDLPLRACPVAPIDLDAVLEEDHE